MSSGSLSPRRERSRHSLADSAAVRETISPDARSPRRARKEFLRKKGKLGENFRNLVGRKDTLLKILERRKELVSV